MKLDGLKRAGTIGLAVLGVLGGLDSIIKGVKDLKGISSDGNSDTPANNKTDEEVKETDTIVEAEATPVVEEETE